MSLTTEEKLEELRIHITKIDERGKSNTNRLDEVEDYIKQNNELVTAINSLAIETKYMREDLNKTIVRIDKLEDKESGKWDEFKWLMVGAIVTIVTSYLALRIGLK